MARRKRKVKELRGTHTLACRECGEEEVMPRSAVKFTCSSCVIKVTPGPENIKPKNEVKAKIRQLKKVRQKKISNALLAGKQKPKIKKPPEFPRGWHRRKLFEITVAGETHYYTMGQEITAEEFASLRDDPENSDDKHAGYGRGWHLKKHFVAPDGTVYEYGKEVKSEI